MLAMASVTPTWLSGFDPNSASTIATSLKSLLPSTSSYTSSITSAQPKDPATSSTPAGFNVLAPKPIGAPAGPTQLQQALDSFTVTADTFLIQSAVNGYTPLAAPAAFGSATSYYQGLNETAQTILQAGKSGNYGSINSLA